MAPPKQAEASQTTRKTRVQTRSRGQAEEGEQQPSEIVNVDEIPSPDTTPVNPTPILEEIQQPTLEGTSQEIPVEVQEPQNQGTKTLKEMQPEHTEAAPKVNGTTPNPTTTVEPDESQTTISDHPAGEKVEDVSAWPEWYTEGATRSHWNFKPATTAIERQDTDTKVTSQETCNRNCSTAHTSWGTGRTRATGSYREAQILRP
jgi:hypothetical protein